MNICVISNCETPLGPTNKSRHCRKHYYLFEPERNRQRSKDWYLKNQERVQEKSRQQARSDPERNRSRVRQWCADNPEKVRAQGQTKRARKKEAFVEYVDVASVWHRDAGLCFLCGFPADKNSWHLAHIIPLARGGEHSYANTAVSHPTCNMYQGSHLLEELDVEAFLISREEQLWDS